MASWEYFLTESTAPSYVRRGDPLGFRAAADHYADILAPGLSNRTHDARWLTILSWILVHVRDTRLALGLDAETRTQAQRRQVYDWIRPLELMWIQQAVMTVEDRKLLKGLQLPGRNAVWRHVHERPRPHWGMSAAQWERYRFTGPHAAYRTLLSHVPGLSLDGDPYRPGQQAQRLAMLVGEPFGRPDARATRRTSSNAEATWRRTFGHDQGRLSGVRQWLPVPRASAVRLTAEECQILRPLLFEGDAMAIQRERVASLAAGARAATHSELVTSVARQLQGEDKADRRRLDLLPPFTTFADAGVEAMLAVWKSVKAQRETRVEIDSISKYAACARALDVLKAEATVWRRAAAASGGALAPVHELAEKTAGTASRAEVLRALLTHHVVRGGGRRWFRIHGAAIVADAGLGGEDAALYRFRLEPLCRLATQLGVISQIPSALKQQPGIQRFDGEDAA